MKLLIMQFSPFTSHLIPLRYKYPPQHPVIITAILMFLEAGTELSDLESRVRGLREQLHKKKAEAEKLWKEQQRKKKEQLRMNEQSLLKQIMVRSNLLSCVDYKMQTCRNVKWDRIFLALVLPVISAFTALHSLC
jgi:predicted nuclease with TOPRIM domain